ncbi:MAG: hypothetical protein LBQ57_11625 [Spirochaetales bacterium]|jgi:hypothetical protein|nr:hypothetical protein [Spirochaetales bacterium]
MENIDATGKNQRLLLDLLMESMPKTPELPAETRESTDAPESVKTEPHGEKIDLLA